MGMLPLLGAEAVDIMHSRLLMRSIVIVLS
jgi:hypothetical protein